MKITKRQLKRIIKEAIDVVDDEPDSQVDIDPVMLRDALVDATTNTVAQVVDKEVRAMVNRASGRVD